MEIALKLKSNRFSPNWPSRHSKVGKDSLFYKKKDAIFAFFRELKDSGTAWRLSRKFPYLPSKIIFRQITVTVDEKQ